MESTGSEAVLETPTSSESPGGNRFLDDKRFYPFMESEPDYLAHILEDRIWSLAEAGKWDEAEATASGSVQQARQTIKDEDEHGAYLELAHGLEIYGDLMASKGSVDEAVAAFLEVLDLLKDLPGHEKQRGRIHVQLAVIADQAGEGESSISHYQAALNYLEQAEDVPFLDVADLSNNLAFLLKEQDKMMEAEALYLRSFGIYKELLGTTHEETATLCNNLGGIYVETERWAQAKDIYITALDSRLSLLGSYHPDTGQAHGNLAVVLSEVSLLDDAERHYKKAITIFESISDEYAEDLDAVVTNYGYFKQRFGR